MNFIEKCRRLIDDEQVAAQPQLFEFFKNVVGDDDPNSRKTQVRILREWKKKPGFVHFDMPQLLFYLLVVREVSQCDIDSAIKGFNGDTRRLCKAVRSLRQDLSQHVVQPSVLVGATALA